MRINGQEVFVSRSDVQTIPCPSCRAAAGEQCVGARDKLRERNHMERIEAYVAKRQPQHAVNECPRAGDHVALDAFATEHFPGVHPQLVAHGAMVCRRNNIPPTSNAIWPVIRRWLPQTVAS